MKSPVHQTGVLKRIAEEAGCSPSTVSRVLNGCRKGFSVRKDLEERIRAIAAASHYQPNPFLRIMRAKDSRLIAIFDPVHDLSPILGQAKTAFISSIRQKGFLETGKYVSLYQKGSYTLPFPVAAALLFDISDPSFLSFLEETGIPYTVINGMCCPCGASVRIDEQRHMHSALDCLCEKGHSRIAFYAAHRDAGTRHQHYSGILREKYFYEELAARGLPRPPEVLADLLDPTEYLARIRKEFQPTAIICYDHVRAVGIMTAAIQAGLRLPDDLSLLSMTDDFPLGQLPMPIAAFSLPAARLGECDAGQISRLLNETLPEEERTVLIRGRLLKRHSIVEPKKQTAK